MLESSESCWSFVDAFSLRGHMMTKVRSRAGTSGVKCALERQAPARAWEAA